MEYNTSIPHSPTRQAIVKLNDVCHHNNYSIHCAVFVFLSTKGPAEGMTDTAFIFKKKKKKGSWSVPTID